MRQVPGRALWLGNAGDLRDARAVLAADVAAVMELSDGEPFAVLPRNWFGADSLYPTAATIHLGLCGSRSSRSPRCCGLASRCWSAVRRG